MTGLNHKFNLDKTKQNPFRNILDRQSKITVHFEPQKKIFKSSESEPTVLQLIPGLDLFLFLFDGLLNFYIGTIHNFWKLDI